MSALFLADAVLFSLAAAAATTAGLLAVAIWRDTTRAQTGWFAAFAAGALITIAILHLIPEAFEFNGAAPTYLLAGFAGAYFLNNGVLAFTDKRPALAVQAGLLPVLAIAAHSFVDGMAYAVTFSVDFETGLLTVIGLIFHEVPEGIIVFTLLQRAGLSNRRALALAFLAAAATTPLGAVTTQAFLSDLSTGTLGLLFATMAGVLLFIGTSHLLPHVASEPFARKVPALLLGGLIGATATLLHPEDHAHDTDADHPSHAPERTTP